MHEAYVHALTPAFQKHSPSLLFESEVALHTMTSSMAPGYLLLFLFVGSTFALATPLNSSVLRLPLENHVTNLPTISTAVHLGLWPPGIVTYDVSWAPDISLVIDAENDWTIDPLDPYVENFEQIF